MGKVVRLRKVSQSWFFMLIQSNQHTLYLHLASFLKGRHYDKDGDLKDWWTPASTNRFLDLSKCIVNQYSNFSWDLANGLHVCLIENLSHLLLPTFSQNINVLKKYHKTLFIVKLFRFSTYPFLFLPQFCRLVCYLLRVPFNILCWHINPSCSLCFSYFVLLLWTMFHSSTETMISFIPKKWYLWFAENKLPPPFVLFHCLSMCFPPYFSTLVKW